jgi:probable DNA metabolism protein
MPADDDVPFTMRAAASTGNAGPGAALRTITLASAVDFEGFRRACRLLWAEQVAPEHVGWHCADDAEGDLFEEEPALADPWSERPTTAAAAVPPVNAPAVFLPLSESAVLHRDPNRFALLYRLLWRLQVEPGLRHAPLDADWMRADEMAQAVRRDMHDMKASVRFRAIADGPGGAPLHIAWFEPEHHVVEASAPFFARRFANLRWAIVTPERSVRWDGERLVLGAAVRRDQAPAGDADDRLWLTCYETVFNSARLTGSPTMATRGPTDPPRRRPTEPQPTPGHRETPGGDAPRTLPALREALERCRECPIGEHATQAVAGEGLKHARLMFVGEQPGDQEDLQGRPFVGPAGQLLARALEELGVPRDKVYITNAVKHFKFELRGKRRIHKTPAQQEAAACLHWLESEIELVDPAALVALGATAARQLMGTAVAVTRQRGQWLQRSDGRKVLITLHPSALLRMEPADKAAAYAAWVADLRHAATHFASSDKRAG